MFPVVSVFTELNESKTKLPYWKQMIIDRISNSNLIVNLNGSMFPPLIHSIDF
jgi:hypothetical protein